MHPHLLIAIIGLVYILIVGGMSLLRREGLSNQFAFEVLGITALVVAGAVLTNTVVDPILFLIVVYLLSMRARLLVDLADLLSNRGRQRDAMAVLQFALRLFPDRSTRLVILLTMGIVQLRRQSPESAQELFETVLGEAKQGGLGVRYEAACHYNLGLALQRQGKEAEAIRQFNETIETFPTSEYGRAAAQALARRRAKPAVEAADAADKEQISG